MKGIDSIVAMLSIMAHGQTDNGATIGWPRVNVSCDYRAPLKFEDEVESARDQPHRGQPQERGSRILHTVGHLLGDRDQLVSQDGGLPALGGRKAIHRNLRPSQRPARILHGISII